MIIAILVLSALSLFFSVAAYSAVDQIRQALNDAITRKYRAPRS